MENEKQLDRPFISVPADCELNHLRKYILLDINFEAMRQEDLDFMTEKDGKVSQHS